VIGDALEETSLIVEFDFQVFVLLGQLSQLCDQEGILVLELFGAHRKCSILFFLIDEFVAGSPQFTFSFIDFFHVRACLELVLVRELVLIGREACDLLL
jgi:hypothetical protein